MLVVNPQETRLIMAKIQILKLMNFIPLMKINSIMIMIKKINPIN